MTNGSSVWQEEFKYLSKRFKITSTKMKIQGMSKQLPSTEQFLCSNKLFNISFYLFFITTKEETIYFECFRLSQCHKLTNNKA